MASRMVVRRQFDLSVEGAGLVPQNGPVILAARHFHHLYDGCAVLATINRPVHILVGLDWAGVGLRRLVMERACASASWPVILRRDGANAIDDREATHALRRATSDSLALLRSGQIVLMFPEGYPNIDPGYTPKTDTSAYLPFQPGVVRMATIAARQGLTVPIVPVGFDYRQVEGSWLTCMRFGEPVVVENRQQEEASLRLIEERVRDLSVAAVRSSDSGALTS